MIEREERLRLRARLPHLVFELGCLLLAALLFRLFSFKPVELVGRLSAYWCWLQSCLAEGVLWDPVRPREFCLISCCACILTCEAKLFE